MSFKKIMACLLCIFTIAPLLIACADKNNEDTAGGDDSTSETTAAETSATEFSVFDTLPDKNYDGYEFRVLTGPSSWSEYLERMIVSDMTGDVIFDSVYERNISVEEKYNCVIKAAVQEYDKIPNYITADVLAGDNSFDLAQSALKEMATLSVQDVFLNLRELKYLDFTQPWYPEITNHDLCINSKQFIIQSEFTVTTFSNAYTVFYNIDLGENYGIKVDELYDTVLNGGWTIDKLTAYTKGIYSDLNADGKSDIQDQFGYAAHNQEPLIALQYGMGQFITKLDSSDMPTLAFNADRFTSIIEKLNNLFHSSGDNYLSPNWGDEIYMFRDGQVLFMTCIIMHADRRLRDMENKYTVVPMPKLDESQTAYYTSISPGSAQIFAMPATSPDTERSAIIFEALSAQGYKLVKPAFFEIALKVKYSRDENISKMYDMVSDSRMIDFGYYYDGGTGMRELIYAPIRDNNTDIASAFSKIESKAIEYYKSVTDYYFK